ncbi:MAG: hypothetical protein WA921_12030 [Ahrensia sp.]
MSLKTVLLIGSAPDAMRARAFDTTAVSTIVAINNAWRVRDDWDYLVFPQDFPDERRPVPRRAQKFIEAHDYVPANNAYGGIIYAGATMAFTAAYWILHTLKPDLLLVTGCDMIYDQKLGPTHFYGRGTADPLRKDPTLQSLEAKATRLMLLAARQGCLCANLSPRADSRLTFPRIAAETMATGLAQQRFQELERLAARHDDAKVTGILAQEASLGQFVASGNYWDNDFKIDSKALFDIDMAWRGTAYPHRSALRRSAS